MTLQITESEQEILHHALLLYLEDIIRATDQLHKLGAVIKNPPAMEINALHAKVISAT